MDLDKKIRSLAALGKEILRIAGHQRDIIKSVYQKNQWFVPAFTLKALQGIAYMLEAEKLQQWIAGYPLKNKKSLDIGIIMAGNIPLVGFHDLLTVLLSGNQAIVKLSHNDDLLIPFLIDLLGSIEPDIVKQIVFQNSIIRADAIIATGSDNTSRYFEHAYLHIPHIIRKNRTSCCIIHGDEDRNDYANLADDMFSYFGMGCRNVSKIYIPENFDIHDLSGVFDNYKWTGNHSKYANNYRYIKSICNLENKPFIDGEFFIFREDRRIVSPLACIYYERYQDAGDLDQKLTFNKSKIQCIVSRKTLYPDSISLGNAQSPEPWDYADNMDTMKFLLSL